MTTITGGCSCGAIRYAIAGEPIFSNHCQCTDCQDRSGTGHGSHMTFSSKGAVKLTGQATQWPITADSGNVKRHAFCPTCGTPVYLTFDAMPVLFTVHAASLTIPRALRRRRSPTPSAATHETRSIRRCRPSAMPPMS